MAPPHRGLSFRRLAPSPIDVRIFFGDRAVLATENGTRWLTALGREECVERVERQGAGVGIRFAEGYVAALADRLASAAPDAPLAAEEADGRNVVVNFLNPNATKPLHVGHLRNTTIGSALAASLAAAGARVTTQCYVCDIGRNVCEALAGWEQFHRDATPESVAITSDRFVGLCYADYVRSLGERPVTSAGDPIAAETELANDRADELVRDWLAGDPSTRERWARLRDWALFGQQRTLARIGVRFDRVWLESESFASVERIVAQGTREGWLVREPNGAVLYPAARKEYASLALVRPDGFPTEHARVLGLFVAEAAERTALDEWIVVCGDEWSTAGDVALEIAGRTGASSLRAKVRVIAHGMVTLHGSKMKSRDGKALLIDEFLDSLAAADRVRELARRTDGAVRPETIVEILVKGYFLCRNAAKGIEFDWDSFLDATHNPAWALAEAIAVAESRLRRELPLATDREALRTAVMQYHHYRQILRGETEEFLPTAMTKFAIGLAKWYLERREPSAVDRIVRVLLGSSLASVGIRTSSSDVNARA
ncbi:MAG: arginine--tRNA ligase [Planctomycetes bacterium]|nr:arginine--tRNA ligase [Planctomycetota bacterium]